MAGMEKPESKVVVEEVMEAFQSTLTFILKGNPPKGF